LIDDPVLRAIEITTEAIKVRSSAHWIIAFSGGKDSSAALKIFLASYRRAATQLSKVTLIYCDTGVENPVLDKYAKGLLDAIAKEFLQIGLPFKTKLLKAPIQDRFFVRIIGRGYPPPTNSFRWCTTGLRIKPVSEFIARQDRPERLAGLFEEPLYQLITANFKLLRYAVIEDRHLELMRVLFPFAHHLFRYGHNCLLIAPDSAISLLGLRFCNQFDIHNRKSAKLQVRN
jgi:hypothetical protein